MGNSAFNESNDKYYDDIFMDYDPKKLYPCSPYISSEGFTKLMYLVINARIISFDKIKEYVEENIDKINKKNEKDYTALMIACRNSNTNSSIEIVKLLLDNGANVNDKDNNGLTPLMIAACNSNTDSNVETVKLLLDKGANINDKDNKGWTPLMAAVRNFNTDADIETVKLLLDNGANVNDKNNNGWTPLMLAVRNSNTDSDIETVKLLLDYGATINEDVYGICTKEAIKIIKDHEFNTKFYKRLHNLQLKTTLKELIKKVPHYQHQPESLHSQLLFAYKDNTYTQTVFDYFNTNDQKLIKSKLNELFLYWP